MPRGSKELTEARRKEIIDACAELYKTMSFNEITIKEIGSVISFTRTSVYNYFQTKEEIFLALLQREYGCWNQELSQAIDENDTMTVSGFADLLAGTLAGRIQMLKILSMNLFEIEENSRLERLAEFKGVYKRTLKLVEGCLRKIRPALDPEICRQFQYAFFPFVYGIYPYTTATEKQRAAMSLAGIEYTPLTVEENVRMIVHCLLENNSPGKVPGKNDN